MLILLVASCTSNNSTSNKKDNAIDNDSESVTSIVAEECSQTQTAKWEKITINGVPSVQARFSNAEYGVLEMSYNSSMGFRFGKYNKSGSLQELTTSVSLDFSIRLTQEIIENSENLTSDQIGELSLCIMPITSRDDKYIYCNNKNFIENISKFINNGSVPYLCLKEYIKNINRPSNADPALYPEAEWVDHEWETKFIPGEFEEIIKSI